jgi:CheY-like chemotaxis protein
MPETILVVDDTDQNRLLLHDVLTSHGFMVLLAKDGAEGVAMAVEHQPDLILMDIQMPVMNGLEACKLLRSDAGTKEIRILALSSFSTLSDKDNFFATAFDGYIDKPFDIRELPKTIIQHLLAGKNR